MFKLRRLEITGFKSFADYTEIVFTGNGITAVVGPNGCGKSNVSDAISWVLGEQSPKSLRGQEMKDVVFQGTGKRNPGGMAEVVLHLERDGELFVSDESELEDIDERLGVIDENTIDIDALEAEHLETEVDADEEIAAIAAEIEEESEEVEMVQAAQVGSAKTITTRAKRRWRPRSFALEFAPGEAVSVTRRLYLSGESEYLLNDKTCRLRDIQDLFAGTGLSGAHYAIIEQGRIGRILSSKPSDRRALIEEAAGISKFKTRQRAAESRLDSAKTNLGRISDIVDEIEKRTRSLQRQANKTRRFKVLKEELRELQKSVYAVESQQLTASVTEHETRLDETRQNEDSIKTKGVEKENELKEATGKARLAEESLAALRATHAESALERDRAEREKRYQEEQKQELSARIEDLKTEIRVTQVRIDGLGKEIKETETAAADETDFAAKERTKLQIAESKYRELFEAAAAIESRLDVERADQLQHTAAVERLTEIARQHENDLERVGERIKGLENEKSRADDTLEVRREESVQLSGQLGEERERLEKSRTEKQESQESCRIAREVLSESEAVLNRFEQEYSRKRHRLETLKELEETGAIYEPSVQKLFSAGKDVGVKLLGTLADRFSTDKASDRAVESLFGPFLQAVLVETDKDAVKVVKYLHEHGLGRIPILVEGENGAKGSAKANPEIVKLLGIDEKFAARLASAFPREMSADLVKNLDAPRNNSELVVTLDGDLVVGNRLFVSGSKDPSAKNSSLLEFKRELRELAKEAAASKLAHGTAAKQVETDRSKLKKLEDGLVDLQSYIVQLERDLLSKEIQDTALLQEIDRAERHQKVVEEEIAQLRKEVESLKLRREEVLESVKSAEKAKVETGSRIEHTTLDLLSARKVLEAENVSLNEIRTHAEVAAERMRAAVSSLDRVRAEKKELEMRLERQTAEISSTTGRIEELAEAGRKIAEKIEAALTEIESESEELAAAVGHLREVREASDKMSAEVTQINNDAAAAREERSGIEVRLAELRTRLQNVEENCLHDLNIPLLELAGSVEIDDEFEFETARERVDYLRERIENFGAINMLAVEELTETEERLEFLTSQRQDVIDSIASAEEALREIKRRSRDRFTNAFKVINENFEKFFSELFGGGKGEMVLLEAEDVLEAGIEIIAQPPGKRLQNMLLLSGGEKAMTAIALVLAIFKYHPSPFCLLDEVDAPLDEANVGRFVERIDSMSENTQFIVITHNKRTMEAARALYGVTMQEPGVSKVVSVRFE